MARAVRALPIRRLTAAALGLAAAACLALLAIASSRATLEPPAPTLLLRDRHGAFLGESAAAGEELGYWPVEVLPRRVVAATLALEDRRFWRHGGVDFRAVARAAWQNLESGERVSGASTLAMQVARMQRPGPRTYPRKALEAATAALLTRRWGRQAILRQYLRIVPYGNRIHGIGYAARRYLDKPVADLSWAETAFLAAIPQAPARMSPFDPRGKARAVRRGRRILAMLRDGGVLSDPEHRLAQRQIGELRIPPRGRRPEAAMHAVLRFEELFESPERRAALRADPVVTTTLDLELQGEVAWLTWEALAEWERRGAGNAAVLVVDTESWEVRAAVGSADYFDQRHAGAIDYLRLRRSSGSTLKPFFYGLALERGALSPVTLMDDLRPGAGGIVNSDGRFLGPLLPRVALATSRNVPAADLLADIGLDEGHAFLAELGLHDRTEPARRYGLGLTLGGLAVTLEDLVRSYTVLAGDGRLHDLVWYRRQPRQRPRRQLSAATARLLALFLSDPQARLPTFPRMGFSEYPFPVAVKTGTSSRYRDAWTVAFSSRTLVGVWVGHPDHRPMHRLSGYRAAARLAQRVMRLLHADDLDGLGDLAFPPPAGYRAERVCTLSGRRAGAACDRVVREWLPPDHGPLAACEVHRHLAVDRRDGLLATERTPRRHLEVRSFVDLPPRYAAWASTAGLPRPPRLPSPLGTGAAVAAAHAPLPGPLRLTAAAVASLSVTSPEPHQRLLLDPETPPERSTLALSVVVDPPPEQVVWYVDGAPYRTVDYPFTTRWPLVPGDHTFQARVPYSEARSSVVRVAVE